MHELVGQQYLDLIKDAELQVGKYIVLGGESTDDYVRLLVTRIIDWSYKCGVK